MAPKCEKCNNYPITTNIKICDGCWDCQSDDNRKEHINCECCGYSSKSGGFQCITCAMWVCSDCMCYPMEPYRCKVCEMNMDYDSRPQRKSLSRDTIQKTSVVMLMTTVIPVVAIGNFSSRSMVR